MINYMRLLILLNEISDVLPFSQDNFTVTEKCIQQTVIRIREEVELPPHLHAHYYCDYCEESTNEPENHRYCGTDDA